MTDDGRVALVTGAAGDIGRSLCHKLVARGFHVVGWDIVPAADGVPVTGWQTVDLSGDAVPTRAAGALAGLGPLTAVFHVVGGSDTAELAVEDLTKVPLDAFRRTIGLNLTSAFAVIQATVDEMRKAGGDRSYTLVSSTNALGGYRAPGYSAAKAGLHGMVRALAGPLGSDGIRINAVALGTTRTANFVRLAEELGRRADFGRIGARIPRGRVLSPDEAADSLISIGVDNPAVSGTVLVADAAQSLTRP
jgi:NAD(P)-dependent dehydrogenase (short-subunit alcohol dehydrogenase family)